MPVRFKGMPIDLCSDVACRIAVIGNFQRNVEMLGFFPTFVVWSAAGVNDEEAMIALKFNVVQLLALG